MIEPLATADIRPRKEDVLPPSSPNRRQAIRSQLDDAMELFMRLCRGQAIRQPVSIQTFAAVFQGEGKNHPRAPLQHIFPKAQALYLFALTLGQALSDAISDLFARKEWLTGYFLDALASQAADNGARLLEQTLENPGDAARVLAYSPGYCGWDMTGQRALFAALKPGAIGITLTDSCLMQPLKSVSGVLVSAGAEAHTYTPDFPFCRNCRTRSCLERMARLVNKQTTRRKS